MPGTQRSARRTIPIKPAKPSPKLRFDCNKCPAYCCSYPLIEIGKRDVARLARHFGITYAQAEKRYTRYDKSEKAIALKHRKDRVFKSVCMFLDQRKGRRHCTIYDARPAVCRDYPNGNWCGYYDFLRFEREQQDDAEFIATT